MDDNLRGAIIALLECLAVLAILAWCISFAVRSALGRRSKDDLHQQWAKFAPKPYDGPGRYRVEGVDRATRMDGMVFIHAASLANAKAKAELDGMIVTSIQHEE